MRSKAASPLPLATNRPVKQVPLSDMTWAGNPQSVAPEHNASHAPAPVGPGHTLAATSSREWSSRTSIIHASVLSASSQRVASICHASLGRGHTNRLVADLGRLRGCGVTNPPPTRTRWMVDTAGVAQPARRR